MEPLISSAIALFVYMTSAYVVSLIIKDNGIADIAYGGGFALLAWLSYVLGGGSLAGFFVSVLATVWALRLSVRIFLRNHGKPEDFRYRAWREAWGKTFLWRSYLQVYLLQGLVIYLVSLPLTLTNLFGTEGTLGIVSAIALVFWGVGFFFEAVGDYQLARFMGNPENKGKIMDQGLWRYTRHPNYFGESLMWWALALFAATVLWPSSTLALAVFVSPLLITFLLLKVSGVPMLEARFAGNPAWEAYKARTSVFIPLPPKRA